MVTCQSENQGAHMQAIKSASMHKTSGSDSSEFSLLKSDQQQEVDSNTSNKSLCKLKIDLMFNGRTRSDNRSHLNDPQGSHRTRSIIMYSRNKLNNSISENSSTVANFKYAEKMEDNASKNIANKAKTDVKRISSNVQAEIEQLFADVAKEASSTFTIAWLGCLPIKDKITTLEGLQKPLRELYLQNGNNTKHKPGSLDICATGLLIKVYANECEKADTNQQETRLTPFHNIAVWSAVRFSISNKNCGAAFLPLITSPESIDKSALFQPLSPTEYQRMISSQHAPIFAIVMRSASIPKMLECHAFICKSTEDAIVIAATLYQSLMSHVTCNSDENSQRRAPRNKNGISCVSIASSSDITNSQPITRRLSCSIKNRKNSIRSVNGSVIGSVAVTTQSVRKKRNGNSLKSTNNNHQEIENVDSFSKETKKKSYKTKRAPPIPAFPSHSPQTYESIKPLSINRTSSSLRVNRKHDMMHLNTGKQNSQNHTHRSLQSTRLINSSSKCTLPDLHKKASVHNSMLLPGDNNGDILTRVAIPRSGSFLNTSGLSRYKSKTARRYYDKIEDNTSIGGGGGSGSPLGFNELFNEFRLHENLHSLDEILYSIINADGMSFNDLKPIYKEFLIKLSLTLTKDELFQKSKNIMRRQRKRKFKYNNMLQRKQKNGKRLVFGTKTLKKVFQMGHFRSCRNNSLKSAQKRSKKVTNYSKEINECSKHSSGVHLTTKTCITHRNQPHNAHQTQRHLQKCQRNRATTSSSDVSVVRTDNHVPGLNRNSSSGYVSCSECSYNSEDCTCTSVDRCYCSLRRKNTHNKVRRKNNPRTVSKRSKKSNVPIVAHTPTYNRASINRLSYISCNSDEKCYCSMTEEQDTEPKIHKSDKTNSNNASNTSWCDSDSCKSVSKCYCQPLRREVATLQNSSGVSNNTSSDSNKASNKLVLDYELFNIDTNNSRPVQTYEALSVKKSVEAAAIFADLKLTQTTDIKSLCTRNGDSSLKKLSNTYHSYSIATRKSNRPKHLIENCSTIGSTRNTSLPMASRSSQKSYTTDNLFNTFKNIEKSIRLPSSASTIRSNCNSEQKECYDKQQNSQKQQQDKGNSTSSITDTNNCSINYQSMRAVNHSLEDALGYLP